MIYILKRKKVLIFQNDKSNISSNALPRFTKLSATELKTLIKSAQAYEQEAIDKLCEHFKPLVYKEAHRLTVYNALGEDAVNTAWLIFLRFIHRYKGRAYNHLPGLIKYHLHYGLLRQVRKQGRSWDNEVASEELMKMQTHEQLEQPLEKLAIKQVLSTLPIQQFKILKMYYGQRKSNTQIAKQLSCSISTIKRQKHNALNRIKEQLNT